MADRKLRARYDRPMHVEIGYIPRRAFYYSSIGYEAQTIQPLLIQ